MPDSGAFNPTGTKHSGGESVNDLILIAKKIAVGVVVTLVPFGLIVGGLWLTRGVLASGTDKVTTHHQEKK